jgi:hypothetical protein
MFSELYQLDIIWLTEQKNDTNSVVPEPEGSFPE